MKTPKRPTPKPMFADNQPGDHRESSSAVSAFNQGFSARAQAALDDKPVEPSTEAKKVEQPKLTDEDHMEARSLHDFVDAAAFSIERDKAGYEVLSKNLARARQIEDRLEPLVFEDALFAGFVEQVVPVHPEKFVLRIRSRSMRLSQLAKAAAAEVAKDPHLTPEILSLNPDVRLSLEQLGEIATSVVAINGRAPWPHDLSYLWDGVRGDKTTKDKIGDIKDNIMYWMEMGLPFVVEVYAHVVVFDFRVRKVMQTVGYMEETAKNS